MGKTRHEIPCIREGRDHPAGRAIAFAGQTHAGQAWHTPCHVLPLDDRYRDGGPEALADHRSRPDRVWNRIPDDVRRQIIDLALELPELSPRELAVRFTDEKKYFVSEASVYRQRTISSPARPMW